jgi:hypothetical protein
MLEADFFQRALPWTELILRDGKLINDLNTTMSARTSVVLSFLLVACLVLSYRQPLLLAGAAAAGTMLVVLNAALYRFFVAKRGLAFAVQSIFWHWAYFLYSGVAFIVGTVRHAVNRVTSSKKHPPYPHQRTGIEASRMERR